MGRWTAGGALVVSLLLLPLLNQYASLFEGINDVIAHIAPPITCVFLLGVFWEKASAKAAQYTLWFGSGLGIAVFAANKLLDKDSFFVQIPFMMMAFYLFCVCVVLQVTLSFVYPMQHKEESSELYWKSMREPLQAKGWSGIGNYKLLSALLVALMVLLYWIFK